MLTIASLAVAVTMFILPVRPLDGARLLLISDSMSSHVLQFSRLGLELAKLGHEVRVLTPSNARIPDFVLEHKKLTDGESGSTVDNPPQAAVAKGKFNYTTYPVDGDTPYFNSLEYSSGVVQIALTKSVTGKSKLTLELTQKLWTLNSTTVDIWSKIRWSWTTCDAEDINSSL